MLTSNRLYTLLLSTSLVVGCGPGKTIDISITPNAHPWDHSECATQQPAPQGPWAVGSSLEVSVRPFQSCILPFGLCEENSISWVSSNESVWRIRSNEGRIQDIINLDAMAPGGAEITAVVQGIKSEPLYLGVSVPSELRLAHLVGERFKWSGGFERQVPLRVPKIARGGRALVVAGAYDSTGRSLCGVLPLELQVDSALVTLESYSQATEANKPLIVTADSTLGAASVMLSSGEVRKAVTFEVVDPATVTEVKTEILPWRQFIGAIHVQAFAGTDPVIGLPYDVRVTGVELIGSYNNSMRTMEPLVELNSDNAAPGTEVTVELSFPGTTVPPRVLKLTVEPVR